MMGRKSRHWKVLPVLDGMEPRALMAASPVMIAVVASGVDLNAADTNHVVGNTKLLDFTDAYNAIDGSTGQAAVFDTTPTREGSKVVSQVLQGIADSVAAGGNGNVEVVPIQDNSPSLGSPFYALIGGIEHAADIGARVIEVDDSAGLSSITPSENLEFTQALAYARAMNATVVVPSGDGYGATGGEAPVGVNLDPPGSNLVEYLGTFHQSNMLVVAATDSSGNLRNSSNWGSTHVDLGAPTSAANPGTSLASGYAAGVAGVLAATRTDWSAIDVANHIKATVQPSSSLAGKVTSGGMISPKLAFQAIYGVSAPSTINDFEGDLKSDFYVYGNIPALNGYAFEGLSSTQGFGQGDPMYANNAGYSIGGKGTIPLSGKFYGGNVTHPALLSPEYGANGQLDGKYDFAILSESGTGLYDITTYVTGLGQPGDIPVVGDYVTKGQDDLAFYGDHNGQYNFLVLSGATGFNPNKMYLLDNNGSSIGGLGSVPVVGDFFGDGKADPAVYAPDYSPNGQLNGKYEFFALDSGSLSTSFKYTKYVYVGGIGQEGDIPIVGDYDGDGKSDLALYGDHNGQYNFQVLTSSSGFNPAKMLILNNNGQGIGGPGSVPISGDFFGDGASDVAVYGPELNANGQSDGVYDLTVADPKSMTKTLLIRGFGGPNLIADATTPYVKWFQAQNG